LYKAQANDCYWHGQFGGVYLSFLRHSVYRHAIDAENAIISLMKKESLVAFPIMRKGSFLKDGRTQLVLETTSVNAFVNVDDGGTIFELDFKPLSYNLMNTLARWREAYHEGGNAASLVFDKVRKVASRDFIVKGPVDFKAFQDNKVDDVVGFSTGPFALKNECIDGDKIEITLEQCGMLENQAVSILKKITVHEREATIMFSYHLEGLPEWFFERYTIIIDFPIFFNGDPKGFVVSSAGDKKNPLDGVMLVTNCFSLLDTSYGLEMSFELSDTVNVSTWSHVTFSRMNTNDYQSKYQGIGMAFNPKTTDFSITCNMKTK
nr:DUF1926 domain-containing protein [Candidatus Sigynarchaeota archaeon]